MTDPLGQSQVLPYLKGLSKEGYEFHLISFEKSDRYKRYKKLIRDLCDEDNIHWHPQYYSKESGLKKTLKQVRKLKKVSAYLEEKHHFDIVHCRSYIAALAGLQLKRKKGVKFVFDMRGFWADERVDGGLWNLDNFVYKRIYNYFKKKEVQFFNTADYTISLTENGKNEICSWDTIRKDIKIQVIPCCVDLNLFDKKKIDPEIIQARRKELGLQTGDFVLGYVGSIGTWYMLPDMLDYFIQLKKEKENAKFLFVTGEDPKNIQRMAYEKGIDGNDLKITSVLHHQVPEHIALMDASIFFIRPSYSKKASSPTKQGEIMAMGVPLVCNSNVGDTDEIVKKYHSGMVIEDFNAETYHDNIIDPKAYNGDEIAAGAKDYFSLEEGVRRYKSVYLKICE